MLDVRTASANGGLFWLIFMGNFDSVSQICSRRGKLEISINTALLSAVSSRVVLTCSRQFCLIDILFVNEGILHAHTYMS